MIIIFNTAFMNDDYKVIDVRKDIIWNYICSIWFWIDLVSIIPFQWMLPEGRNTVKQVRMLRLGRLSKIVKLLRLMKFYKIKQHRLNPVARSWVHLSLATEHLLLFITISTLIFHILACLWLF